MLDDSHLSQLKKITYKVYIFGQKVLHSIMIDFNFRKFHQIPIEKWAFKKAFIFNFAVNFF